MPYPPNKGDKIRSFHILQYLSSRYILDLAFLIDDVSDLRRVDELRRFASTIFFDVIKPKKKFFATVSAVVKNQPVSVPYFYSRNLQRSLDDYFSANIPECVFCFSSPSAEYVFQSKHFARLKQSSRLIMDLIDLDSLKWLQYAENSSHLVMAPVYRREARLLARYEQKIADLFQALLLVSEAEKQLCPDVVRQKVTVVPNGVDLARFAPGMGKAIPADGPLIVFTGAMDYWPNIDAVSWFAREIFPLVLAVEPQARFYIVGANPKPEVLELGTRDHVVVTGFVEDTRDFIAAAAVCVAPLRIARGIQNKVLEAMAMGKAVVATSEAVEGVTVEAAGHVLVADTAENFSRAVLRLLSNQRERQALGAGARHSMESHYAWQSNLAPLDALIA